MDTLDQIEQSSIKVPFVTISIQWGIIGGLAAIILSVVLYIFNLQYMSGMQLLSMLIMFTCTFLCVRTVRSMHPIGLLPFGRGFCAGFFTCLLISLIGMLFFLIYIQYIDTNYYEQLKIIARDKMFEKGLSEQQVEMALKMQAKYMSPGFTMLFAGLMNLFLSVFFALISAGILKKKPS